MTLHLPIGIPGSGKSFLAFQMFGHDPDVIVSPDTFREVLSGHRSNQDVSGLAWKIARDIATTRLAYGLDVYLDATNLNASWYKEILEAAESTEHDVVFHIFQTNVEICKERNNKRDVPVPDSAMERMIDRYNSLQIEKLEEHGTVRFYS